MQLAKLALAALVAAAATAVVAPAAQATVTNQLDVGAQLLAQPKGQPWAVNLLLGAKVFESTGQENLPVTTSLAFKFPHAGVHADQFATCSAKDATLISKGPSACPAASRIGSGKAQIRAIGVQFNADVQVFNGTGTTGNRKLILWTRAIEVPSVVVILHGTLKRISSGQYGYQLSLPVPPIPIVPGQFAAIESFQVSVGKRITKKGRPVSYIDAPTTCSGAGWPFTFTDTLAGGIVATDASSISCTIKGS